MSKLILTLKYGFDPVDLCNWFSEQLQEGDTLLSCERTRLFFHRWQLVYSLKSDTLTQDQFGWIVLHMDFLAHARFETSHVGLVGRQRGKFRLHMQEVRP